MKSFLFGLALLLSMPTGAFAIGEVFKIESSGTEYCGNFDAQKFSSNNNIDLWVFIASEEELVVSLTPTFDEETYFSMFGGAYLTGSGSTASFVAGVLFEDGSYGAIQGIAKAAKTGGIASLSGVFIQNGVFRAGCFSSGKFKTTERLF